MRPFEQEPASASMEADEILDLYPAVLAFLRHRLPGHPEDAEELTQDTIVAAWAARGRGHEAQVRDSVAYVMGIARHKLNDFLAQEYRRPSVPMPEPVEFAIAEQRLLESQRRERLGRCLRRLRSPEREMLYLRYFEQIGNDEASRRLGIDPAEGSRVKFRALERLRFCMRASRNKGDRQTRGDS